MTTITINGNTFDPNAPVVQTLGLRRATAVDSNYILIQTNSGRLQPDQIAELTSKEVVIHEYVSENTYLAGYEPEDLEEIRALPFIAYANVYLPLFVVASDLKKLPVNPSVNAVARVTTASRERRLVDVVFHEGAEDDATKHQVAAAARADVDTLNVSGNKIRISVPESRLENIAKIDGVRSINAVYPVQLRNNVARKILNADVKINNTEYKGEGQIVAVADTGFDTGDASSPHPAFQGRVKTLYSLGRESGKTNDPDGHGTHVCGSVLGDGTSSTMGGRIEAPASRAQLVMQSVLDDGNNLGGIPDDLASLFADPYTKDGARVHTNSWGVSWSGRQLSYGTNTSAGEIDRFVWDHPDMVILFAAGNDGADEKPKDGVTDSARVGAEASAKNCITVGASENLRPDVEWAAPPWNERAKSYTYGQYFSADFPKDPIAKDHMANNAEGIAAFSTFGPTVEKRIKPDVVAPGTSILSACSRDIEEIPEHYGKSKDKLWMFETGTSMATPLVAGCAAVLRETQVKNGRLNPSAALIKALLINGAVDITGQYPGDETGTSPSPSAGFGRVDLAGSVILPDSKTTAGAGDGPALKQGEEWTTTITIPKEKPTTSTPGLTSINAERLPHPTLKVTLVYTDYPGALLQNDLNLVVEMGQVERHGNKGIQEFPIGSTTKTTFDGVNNVEQIVWTGIPAGEVKIKVKARAVTKPVRGAQGFAYVWRIY